LSFGLKEGKIRIMLSAFYLIFFFFGLAAGSFLNCIIYRLEIKSSFLRGRSFCPHCKHILSWQDLIPVFSFLILKGKCSYCDKKISWQYPLVELATGILFVLVINNQYPILNFQSLLFTVYRLLISCFLIIIFIYDLKHYIIPDKVIYPAIVMAIVWLGLNSIFFNAHPKSYLLNSISSALGAALFFWAIVLVSKGKWMGLGDIKLAFLMGLFLGFPEILVALFGGFLIGAIIGLGLVATKKKTLESEVPFAPFLVAGTFIATLWGESLISWYLSLFLFY